VQKATYGTMFERKQRPLWQYDISRYFCNFVYACFLLLLRLTRILSKNTAYKFTHITDKIIITTSILSAQPFLDIHNILHVRA